MKTLMLAAKLLALAKTLIKASESDVPRSPDGSIDIQQLRHKVQKQPSKLPSVTQVIAILSQLGVIQRPFTLEELEAQLPFGFKAKDDKFRIILQYAVSKGNPRLQSMKDWLKAAGILWFHDTSKTPATLNISVLPFKLPQEKQIEKQEPK